MVLGPYGDYHRSAVSHQYNDFPFQKMTFKTKEEHSNSKSPNSEFRILKSRCCQPCQVVSEDSTAVVGEKRPHTRGSRPWRCPRSRPACGSPPPPPKWSAFGRTSPTCEAVEPAPKPNPPCLIPSQLGGLEIAVSISEKCKWFSLFRTSGNPPK